MTLEAKLYAFLKTDKKPSELDSCILAFRRATGKISQYIVLVTNVSSLDLPLNKSVQRERLRDIGPIQGHCRSVFQKTHLAYRWLHV